MFWEPASFSPKDQGIRPILELGLKKSGQTSGSKRILYADDDQDDRDILVDALSPFSDYTLLTFPDGQDLIEHLRRSTDGICLVVLDMNMAKLSGIQTLDLIRKEFELIHLPVIVFTTSSNPADQILADDNGAMVFIKPNSLEKMGQIARQMIVYCEAYHDRF